MKEASIRALIFLRRTFYGGRTFMEFLNFTITFSLILELFSLLYLLLNLLPLDLFNPMFKGKKFLLIFVSHHNFLNKLISCLYQFIGLLEAVLGRIGLKGTGHPREILLALYYGPGLWSVIETTIPNIKIEV